MFGRRTRPDSSINEELINAHIQVHMGLANREIRQEIERVVGIERLEDTVDFLLSRQDEVDEITNPTETEATQ